MGYRVAIDAMGGDNAPHEIIKGTIRAMQEDPELEIVFVGDETAIGEELTKAGFDKTTAIEIVHTDQAISMDASPKKALKENPNASVALACRLLHEGKADALVSAGNTGGTVLAAAQNLDMVDGIERSGLAAIYPTARFDKTRPGFALILDVGATLHCTPKQLVHFAFMGNYYVENVLGIENPRIGLLNIGEEDIEKESEILNNPKIKEVAANMPIMDFCAQIEAEIAQLDDEDAKIFMEDMGIKESSLNKVIRTSYDMLGYINFFTAGNKEVHTWTIRKNNRTALDAAGKIHTDMARGFIRAEVVNFEDLMKADGSWSKAKEMGNFHLVGKEHEINDGDIIVIRFNV